MYGDFLLDIAKGLDKLSVKYNMYKIFDVPDFARNSKSSRSGGVMLNHDEHKLTLDEIESAINLADEVGHALLIGFVGIGLLKRYRKSRKSFGFRRKNDYKCKKSI